MTAPPTPLPSDADHPLRDHTVAILGGTGDQGRGLARRFAAAGLPVVLGSRDADRAAGVAEALGADLSSRGPAAPVRGADNEAAARAATIAVVAVPWAGHAATLAPLVDALTDTVVVDCVNPLGFDTSGPFPLPVPEGSAAQQAAALLPDSQVTAAFHHVSAVLLNDPEVAHLEGDVLVLGDDREAVDLVVALAGLLPGMRGIAAGRLRNAGQVEALTANLIAINRRYRAHACIAVTDVVS